MHNEEEARPKTRLMRSTFRSSLTMTSSTSSSLHASRTESRPARTVDVRKLAQEGERKRRSMSSKSPIQTPAPWLKRHLRCLLSNACKIRPNISSSFQHSSAAEVLQRISALGLPAGSRSCKQARSKGSDNGCFIDCTKQNSNWNSSWCWKGLMLGSKFMLGLQLFNRHSDVRCVAACCRSAWACMTSTRFVGFRMVQNCFLAYS